MRRAYVVNPFLVFDVNPPTFNMTAGKREGMRAFAIDNGQFEIAIKRRGIYQVPFHGGIIHRRLTSRFDLNHLVSD